MSFTAIARAFKPILTRNMLKPMIARSFSDLPNSPASMIHNEIRKFI